MSPSVFICQLLRIPVMLVAILFLSMAKSNPGETDCLVPDEAHLLSLLIENGGVVLSLPGRTGDERPESFYPSPRNMFKIDGTNAVGHSDVNPVDWHCPVGEKPPKEAPLNEISSCPWRFVLDRDPTRYPVTVFHAVRRCGSCLGPGGAVIPGTRCEPVTYGTKVLRQRGCEQPGGIMQYDVENMELTVAFQCTINDETLKG